MYPNLNVWLKLNLVSWLKRAGTQASSLGLLESWFLAIWLACITQQQLYAAPVNGTLLASYGMFAYDESVEVSSAK